VSDFVVDPSEHLGLAWKAARKYGQHKHLEDTAALAMVHIVRAAKDYDPSRGRFSTFAMRYARTAIWQDYRRRTCKSWDERRTVAYTDLVDKNQGADQSACPVDAASEHNKTLDRVATIMAMLPDTEAKALREWMDERNRKSDGTPYKDWRKAKAVCIIKQAVASIEDLDAISEQIGGGLPRSVEDAYTPEEAWVNAVEDRAVEYLANTPWQTINGIRDGMGRAGLRRVPLNRELRHIVELLVDRGVLLRRPGMSPMRAVYAVKGGGIHAIR
jgi:hypothetical protein